MSLTPPSQVTFFLAVLLTVFSLLVRYTHVDIPIVSGHSYETLSRSPETPRRRFSPGSPKTSVARAYIK